jgi:CheY-like chemotaxis protein
MGEKKFDSFLTDRNIELRPGSRVLIVDDEIYIRFAARRILEQKGFCVVEASHGAEALQLIAEEPPDLVFLDLKMPGIPGVEVLRRIRERWPNMPVVVLTGCLDGRQVEAAKAFSPNLLLSKVESRQRAGGPRWIGLAEAAEALVHH